MTKASPNVAPLGSHSSARLADTPFGKREQHSGDGRDGHRHQRRRWNGRQAVAKGLGHGLPGRDRRGRPFRREQLARGIRDQLEVDQAAHQAPRQHAGALGDDLPRRARANLVARAKIVEQVGALTRGAAGDIGGHQIGDGLPRGERAESKLRDLADRPDRRNAGLPDHPRRNRREHEGERNGEERHGPMNAEQRDLESDGHRRGNGKAPKPQHEACLGLMRRAG